jgi:hypothetical protein
VSDYRDLTISLLVDDEAAVIDRVVQLSGECDVWRLLALCAIEQLADLTQQFRRVRAQHHQLLDEYRSIRRVERAA